MKNWVITLFVLFNLTMLVAASADIGDGVTKANELMNKVSELTSIENSKVNLEMRVFRKKELSKTYKMELKYKDSKHSMSETLFPPRSKGEIMMHSDKNDWLYLPRINRVIRVSLSDSFSNSDFSNLDIMDTEFKDYKPAITGSEKIKGEEYYKLELNAITDNSTYAKIVMWVRKSDYFVAKRKYYTYSGHLIKEMALYNKNNLMNGMPDTFVMTSTLEKDKYTVLQYKNISRNQKYADGTFTRTYLTKK